MQRDRPEMRPSSPVASLQFLLLKRLSGLKLGPLARGATRSVERPQEPHWPPHGAGSRSGEALEGRDHVGNLCSHSKKLDNKPVPATANRAGAQAELTEARGEGGVLGAGSPCLSWRAGRWV